MSFRDLRNFTEMMRALGYPRLISMENFRSPNFGLVAEILIWLVRRYDPNAQVSTDTDTESDRVLLIKSIAQFMATKAHIKMNARKLYQADGYAVKELLKVTTLLYNAVRMKSSSGDGDADVTHNVNFDISSKINELKRARSLASEITAKGATLYDILGKEVDLREIRSTAIGRQLEINEVERGLKACSKAVESDIKKTQTSIDNVASDEANLEAKIEKKKNDLERNQKRLQTLQSVRPAYMDEYETLEENLQKLYAEYMSKFRNQTYLEQLLEEYNRLEHDKTEGMEMNLRKLAEKMKSEEQQFDMPSPAALGSDDEFAGFVDDDVSVTSEDDDVQEAVSRSRPQNSRRRHMSGAVRGPPTGGTMGGAERNDIKAETSKVRGNMGIDLDDDDDDDDSDDLSPADSDIDIDDDDDSDEDIEINERGDLKKTQPQQRPTDPDSDNDF